MALKILTTGLEQYAAGGEGRLQVMIIGGGGAGKTRFASFWPRPIYANCEAGLSSVADRKVPFVDIRKSQDMLDLLTHLQFECRRPYRDRQFQTVVIDTVDAFQRKIKEEWLQANPAAQSFRGFDAWGYLDAKMQMLLTRLLNLDMNVIVLAHFKDKTIKEGTGENATERQELMLQLSGEVKDSIFNDFDLVGWMGTYWGVVDGERIEKRGLTFKRTPEKPFLKDRLHVTPDWMEVRFADTDYTDLFLAVTSRLDDLDPSGELGEIAPSGPEGSYPSNGVPGSLVGGPLPAVDPKDIPLVQFDKPTLQKMARELGLEFKNNHIKAELVAMIEQARAKSDASPASPPEPAASGAASTPVESAQTAPEHKPQAAAASVPPPVPTPAASGSAPSTPTVETEVGPVDPETGVMTEAQVTAAVGGQVLSVTESAEAEPVAPPAPTPAAPVKAAVLEGPSGSCRRKGCGKPLAGENQDYVKISQIKHRMYLCNADYLAAKGGEWSPGDQIKAEASGSS